MTDEDVESQEPPTGEAFALPPPFGEFDGSSEVPTDEESEPVAPVPEPLPPTPYGGPLSDIPEGAASYW